MPARPARADWLVLHDGSRIETKGPWTAKGKLVVFKAADGTLSSLRLSEVDLNASGKVTREAREAMMAPPMAPEPSQPHRKAVLVLTDADIPKAASAPADGGASDGSATDGGDGTTEGGDQNVKVAGLEVPSWQQVPAPDGNGVQIFGTLENKTQLTATDLGLKVSLYDSAGKLIDSRDAVIGRKALPPGGKANFNVSFPGIVAAEDALFEPRYRGFDSSAAPPPSGGEAAPAATSAGEETPASPGGGGG